MRAFFVCYEETWMNLGHAFRVAKLPAPSHSRSGMKRNLLEKVSLYHQAGPIEVFIVERQMATDGALTLLEGHFPGIPKYHFDFTYATLNGVKWETYPGVIAQALSHHLRAQAQTS